MPDVRNLALRISYEGTAFVGYQRQASGRTVQGVLEEAIARVSGESPEVIRLVAAGRTDAGVHATGQVVNFRSASRLPVARWLSALNACLPEDMAVNAAWEVPMDFHSRFSATSRTYLYQVLCRDTADPLRRRTFHRVHVALPMLEEAVALWERLPGTRDMAAFGSTGSTPRGTTITVEEAWVDRGEDSLCFGIRARSFLYHMVRRLVGATLAVAAGRLPPAELAEACEGRASGIMGPTAPAHGLILIDVRYPDDLPGARVFRRGKGPPAPRSR